MLTLVVKGKEVHEVVKCIEVPDAEDVLLDEVRLFLEVRVRLNVVAAMKFCLDTLLLQNSYNQRAYAPGCMFSAAACSIVLPSWTLDNAREGWNDWTGGEAERESSASIQLTSLFRQSDTSRVSAK